ncbi:MAG: hypothetical protein ABIQ93_15970 [Saprospiraceae bacterium]
MKTTTRKFLYPVLLLCLFAIPVLALWAGIRSSYLLLFALTLFLGARLGNYQLRNFYNGLQAMQRRDWPAAETSFQAFLAEIVRRPWIKRLMWLNWGSYTGDIEAMTYNNLGAIGLETQRLDEAKVFLQKALSIDTNYAKPHYNLAVIAVLQNETEASAQHFAEAARLGFTNSSFDQFLTKVQTDYAGFNASVNGLVNRD